jgi:tetratricopeptide (TPR) repeat protein
MSEDDNQVRSALVAVGTGALAVRSATLIKRGLALAKSLQFPEALHESNPSKEQLEDSARFLDRLGQHRQLLGDTDGAIAKYREAIRLNADYALAHYNLGVALGRKGDTDGEIAAYREAIRAKPDFAEAHYNLGLALRDKGDWDGAVAEYREAMRLDPNFASSHGHFNFGVALGRKGDVDGEIAEYREALEDGCA